MTTDTRTDADTPVPDERLPLPHLKAALWAQLADLHEEVQRTEHRPAPKDIVVFDRRHRLRGRRSLYVGAGAIAAAAALVVAVSGQDPAPPEQPHESQLGARIVAATRQAAEDKVSHVTTDFVVPDAGDKWSQYDVEEWSDWAAPGANIHLVLRDQAGNVVEDSAGTFGPHGDVDGPSFRILQHRDRTYIEDCSVTGAGATGGTDTAETIRQELDEGHYYEDGTEVVDGRELLVFRIRPGTDEDGKWVGEDDGFAGFVDPETYLPVSDRFFDGNGNVIIQRTFEYLPRTPENLAKTTVPPVPPGFHEVPDSAAACAAR